MLMSSRPFTSGVPSRLTIPAVLLKIDWLLAVALSTAAPVTSMSPLEPSPTVPVPMSLPPATNVTVSVELGLLRTMSKAEAAGGFGSSAVAVLLSKMSPVVAVSVSVLLLVPDMLMARSFSRMSPVVAVIERLNAPVPDQVVPLRTMHSPRLAQLVTRASVRPSVRLANPVNA